MAKTNDELFSELQYIKGRIKSGEDHAKEHREWEIDAISVIREDLTGVNKRVGAAESTLNWIKGIGAAFVFIAGWFVKE